MPILVAAALVVIYLILGMLYESAIHPVTILSTLPSAGLGALLLLIAFHFDLSVIAIIGIILLIGIVKMNGIMLIDFALDAERNHGMTPEQAVYQACVLRFRPILMTTMAALLGAVPLMVGGGTGSELRQPLGYAIVGGLAVSQLLTQSVAEATRQDYIGRDNSRCAPSNLKTLFRQTCRLAPAADSVVELLELLGDGV